MIDLRAHIGAGSLAFLAVSLILFWFHDQFWWPVDEGVYAYVAQRVLAGDILHRDLIDLHGGYGNLLNIWAFRVFGEDLLSLRYPLVVITVLQCLIAYALLASRGGLVASAGGLTLAAFSFVQFPNPSANWHALPLFFLLCLCLEILPKGAAQRLVLAGLCVGLCFFTRQLSGVFLALGLICVLMSETRRSETGTRAPGLLVGGAAIVGLGAYLASKAQAFGLLWAGIWPLVLLCVFAVHARMTWGQAGRTTALVLGGFLLAGLPLAALAWTQDAFTYWLQDIFFTALLINGQEFINKASFLDVLALAYEQVRSPNGASSFLSGVAWIALVASVPLLGQLTLRRISREGTAPVAAILAVFWAVGALHFQIPIYLFFALPPVLLALLMLLPSRGVAAGLLCLSAYVLAFQTVQPLERGLGGIVQGLRAGPNQPADLPRVSLRLQPSDAAIYRDTLAAIEALSPPGTPLMTLPMDPELNFMTDRPSPVRYYGTPLGLTDDTDLEETIEALDAAAPLVVVHRRLDKYLTPLSARLLELVRHRSGPPEAVGPFDLYLYHDADRSMASADAQ